MHWADVIANQLKDKGGPHRIATGITPSGHIHVGNMREILSGALIHRAARELGVDAKFYYFADDFDPLRKLYPFLGPEYNEHIGKPLSEIPSPGGDGGSYAGYFLRPFLHSLEMMGVRPEVLLSSESYGKGRYAEATRMVLDRKDVVKEVLSRVSGRELEEDFIPYNPKCSVCGRLSTTKPLAWEEPYVAYTCKCGHEGRADTRTDDGKLPWRLDWPARWYWLGVTCEPYGKDHASAGGSYDTASEISRKVFGREPPVPLVYEWIQLKGKGAMHSSTGIVVTGSDMLRMTPPEVLRFLIARNHPSRHIEMDPGLGILNLVDEFDRYEDLYLKGADDEGPNRDDMRRTYQLSLTKGVEDYGPSVKRLVQVPYRHLVTLTQLTSTVEQLVEKLKRTEGLDGIDGDSLDRILARKACVDFWLERFAPEEVKFRLCDSMPMEERAKLDPEMRKALMAMREELSSVKWDAESLHDVVYEGSRSRGIEPKVTFTGFYRMLLGKDKGPRLGFFLSTMEREDVLGRIDQALS